MDRGHLLANQLGGVGDDRRNLVPLYQNANQVVMKKFEDQVKAAVDAGNTVYFFCKPNYDGDNPIPTSITMEAYTADGTEIVNQPNIANVP